jgi:hypothetical protein
MDQTSWLDWKQATLLRILSLISRLSFDFFLHKTGFSNIPDEKLYAFLEDVVIAKEG